MGKVRWKGGPRVSAETVWRRWSRRQLIRRDGMICGLCQEPIESVKDITIDHIQPKCKGGSDKLENLRLAHEQCNRLRGEGFFSEREYPSSWDESAPQTSVEPKEKA